MAVGLSFLSILRFLSYLFLPALAKVDPIKTKSDWLHPNNIVLLSSEPKRYSSFCSEDVDRWRFETPYVPLARFRSHKEFEIFIFIFYLDS